MLSGKHIRLRSIEKTDIWQLWNWHEEKDLCLFNVLSPLTSYDELSQNFSDYFHSGNYLIIEDRDSKPLGICSYRQIVWKNRTCKIDLHVCEEDNDRSIALDCLRTLLTFLYDELNLLRIESYVPEHYTEAKEAVEKMSFSLEGNLRKHLYHQGAYVNVKIYALFKERFHNLSQSLGRRCSKGVPSY